MPSNLLLSKYSSEYLAGSKPPTRCALPSRFVGTLSPPPLAGSKTPCTSSKRASPLALRASPTLAAGQRGREIPCPYRDSLWSWRRYKGQGASPCALLILGGAAPCGTARTPFRCIVAVYHGVGFFAIHFSRFLILKNGENPLFYAGSRRFLVMSYKP